MLLARFGVDLLAVIASWGLFALLFIGVGLAARARSTEEGEAGRAFWVGWAVVVALLQVWHLFLPVDERAYLLVALISAVGLWRHRAGWRDWRAGLKGIGRARWLLVALALIWTAHHALGEPRVYDTGLYHAQAVRWIQSFPIVPGLGNVHGRLAFNNSSFLYDALWNVGPWRGRYFHFANGLLLAVLLIQLILDIPPRRSEKDSRVGSFFSALLLFGVVLAARGPWVSSLSPDLPVFVLGLVISRALLRALTRPDGPEFGDVAFVVLLSMIGVTVKLSFAVFGVAAPLLLMTVRFRRDRRFPLREAAAIGLIGIATLGVWAGRGVVLSGYPAYPSTFGGMPVSWRLPPSAARADVRGIRDWARFYCFSPAHNDIRRWPEVWLRGSLSNENVAIPLVMLAFAAFLYAVKAKKRKPTSVGWLFVPPTAWIAFWLFTAPDPRFAAAAFWVIGGGAAALALDAAWPDDPARARRWSRAFQALGVLGTILLVGYGAIAGKGEFVAAWRATHSLSSALTRLSLNEPFLNGHSFYQGFQPMPRAALTRYRTDSGLEVVVPVEDDRCWDAPLPCTPYRRRDLRLRGASMREGFVTERSPAQKGGE
jgi:hypothetical protein